MVESGIKGWPPFARTALVGGSAIGVILVASLFLSLFVAGPLIGVLWGLGLAIGAVTWIVIIVQLVRSRRSS